MQPGYAELHALSNFTFLRGASHPEELVTTAAALGYRALALTDECSVAGIVRRPSTANWGDAPVQMQRAGADGLPIIMLINFLVGLVMAAPLALITGQWISPLPPWGAPDAAIVGSQDVLESFPQRYARHWNDAIRRKLGLLDERDGDDALFADLFSAIAISAKRCGPAVSRALVVSSRAQRSAQIPWQYDSADVA